MLFLSLVKNKRGKRNKNKQNLIFLNLCLSINDTLGKMIYFRGGGVIIGIEPKASYKVTFFVPDSLLNFVTF